MKKEDLTRHLAETSKLSRAAAADELDRLVHEILQRVRRGQPAELPGLGTLIPNQQSPYSPERASKRKKTPSIKRVGS